MDQVTLRTSRSVLRAWRKWLVRALVFSAVACLAVSALLYQRWTNPSAVRRAVLEHLHEELEGVRVNLESAQLRLLGGIAVSDLRLAREDDPDNVDFLYVPSAVIYHDKEQVLDGRFKVRKIELFRPRLRVQRSADGTWNLAGILKPSPLTEAVATLVIHQGTVLLEDRHLAPAAPPVEIKDLNLTLVNDPLPTLVFEGTATADLAGPVHLKGTRQRQSEETTLALAVPNIGIGPSLVQRLAAYSPDAANHVRQLSGTARVEADLVYTPEAASPLHYDVRCGFSQGRFSHARLPLPLDHLEASLRCIDGTVTQANLTGRSGATEIHLAVKDLVPPDSLASMTWPRELDLEAKHLTISPELFQPLPPTYQKLREEFSPAGLASVSFNYRKTSEGPRKLFTFHAEDMAGSYDDFPYPLDHIHGDIKVAVHNGADDLVTLNLAGLASGAPVSLKGELVGDNTCAVTLDIEGRNVPLDDKLRAALPKRYQELAEAFHPTGQGDVQAHIRRAANSHSYSNNYLITFHDATARYDVFPYPLENVSGILEIRPTDWEFRKFHGTHNGGTFDISGHCRPVAGGDQLTVNLRGKNLLLDEEIEHALESRPVLQHTWKVFAPAGHIDFEGTVERPPGGEPDVDLTVHAHDCRVQPAFFRYRLDDVNGKIRYAHHWVEVDGLHARHGDTVVSLDGGSVYVKPNGGVWTELLGLQCRPLVPDSDFVHALPENLQKACLALHFQDPLTLNTKLVIDSGPDPEKPPTIYWDGWAGLKNVRVRTGVQLEQVTGQVACRGRHNGHQLEGVVGNVVLKQASIFRQPLEDVRCRIEVSPEAPDVIRLPGLYARYCGGEIYGPVRLELGSTLRYELKLTASEVQLEQFARQNNLGEQAQMSGVAAANLHLVGDGTDINDLRGTGSVSVPEGKISRLPLLLDLLKVVGLRPPDRTAFEEAQANFEINGPRVHVQHIDLFGNAISLRGDGDLNLDGTDINLDFNVDLARFQQMLPDNFKKIPVAISDNLLRIKMRGNLGDIHFSKDAVPGLMDPFRRMMQGLQTDRTPADDGRSQRTEASTSGQGQGTWLRLTQYLKPGP